MILFPPRFERLLGKVRQFSLFTPSIQSVVQNKARHFIGNGSHFQSRVEQRRAFHQQLNTFTHHLLLRIGLSQSVQLLTPYIYLFAEVYHNRADVRARQAKRTGRDVATVFLWIIKHTEIDTYRTRNKIRIGVSSAPTVYRTSIHTCSAADTVHYLAMLGHTQNLTASVIDNDKMLFATLMGSSEMRSVCSDGLSRCRTCKQTCKDTQRFEVGDNLVNPESTYIVLSFWHDIPISAFPSFVQTITSPVEATAKLPPVIAASAFRKS